MNQELGEAGEALATALALKDQRLVRAVTSRVRLRLCATGPGVPADRATQSLLLRQIDRAAHAGAFAEATPILAAFRSAIR